MKTWLILLAVGNLVAGNWIMTGLLGIWAGVLTVGDMMMDEEEDEEDGEE